MKHSLYAVQVALNAAGFKAGRPDGIYGPQTRDALKAFQTSRGLVADGLFGPRTEAALFPPPGHAEGRYLNDAAFSTWAPRAVPNTRQALEAAIAAYVDLRDANVLDDWLGQMWVESAGFSVLVENLNYSVAGLRATFGRHRISDAECEAFGRKPGRPANQRAIANTVYGGEWGRVNLGNVLPNDGWDFRGSGVKQITGRRNVEASGFSAEDLRTDIFKSCRAAADFFVTRGCVPLARRGDVAGVTRKINGGSLGLVERGRQTSLARNVIL